METTPNTLIAADGTRIAWTRRGAGEPVVLVHGITESSRSLGPVVDRLATTCDTITVDLRGHGDSGDADDYGLDKMATDVIEVMAAAGITDPHLVGHSLGGVVVSAVGAAVPVKSVTNVDQALSLGAFKEQLAGAEPMLRDATAFPSVIGMLFDDLMGPALSDSEKARLATTRRPEQAVVLGVWDLILTSPLEEIEATVDAALAGYGGAAVPYLSLFGADPGPDYADWLQARIPSAIVELWHDNGHYPHLVDPDRFVARLKSFWAST